MISRYYSSDSSVAESKPSSVIHNAVCKIFIPKRSAEIASKAELNLCFSVTPWTKRQILQLVTITLLQPMLVSDLLVEEGEGGMATLKVPADTASSTKQHWIVGDA